MTQSTIRSLLRVTAEAAAERHWREAGAASARAALSVYMATYRRRWGSTFALEGARLRIARTASVEGAAPHVHAASPAGFDPARHAHFTHAQVPLQRGPPQGQRQ